MFKNLFKGGRQTAGDLKHAAEQFFYEAIVANNLDLILNENDSPCILIAVKTLAIAANLYNR